MNTPVPVLPEKKAAAVQANLLGRAVWLLWAIVIALAIAFCFFASSFCVTLLLAAFLAILVEPLVATLERCRLPRSVAAALVILAAMTFLAWIGYISYSGIVSGIDMIPEYADRIRHLTKPIHQRIEQVQEGASKLGAAQPLKKVPEVSVQDAVGWPSYIIRGSGPILGAVIIVGVVPFLMFFSLIRKDLMYERLKIALGHKIDLPRFVHSLTRMVRGFAIGNLIIGSAMALITVGVFYWIGLQGAVFLGIVCGFLNLIPFLGVLLATALPLSAALLQFDTAMPFIVISLTIIFLHIIAANLLVPKFIGQRVTVGAAAATAGILFWGWLWGPVGVLLSVPLTAFIKLVADSHPSLIHISNLLAERPRPVPAWFATGTEKIYRAVPYLRKRSSPAPTKP